MLNEIMSYMTEERLLELLDRYRSFGPLPGILLTFLKSFIPPLPTLLIVGVNAAVYGLWAGFLYSWIGIVGGCMTTFLIVRAAAGHRLARRWADKPKVQASMGWIRRNAFSYVFVLSLFPVGPFVLVNMAAAVSRMSVARFFTAIAIGKGIMVLTVSYVGHDVARFYRDPVQLLYVVVFIFASWYVCKRIEAKYMNQQAVDERS
ncbi:TVP38/TMEM64 family protein [Paenibacillus pasadenensis]|uniref:TVP38/TMEM64 family protein n=1 Tax=Paenibacillus pasadenensis TaxID=217090 RepID=UPI00203E941E|nr:TVP38/TMEM64 family protein [Paenibacillus pasadenensis]MCM3749981.1 TVP38/TMEM64 family protein [Paenibacillus pasadenensis]